MKTKISTYQLFSSIILFEYGTAVLFFIAPKTKQDAWIAMLIYILPAILLQLLFTALWYKYPKDTLVTYMPKIWGKFIGTILSGMYILYFSYISTRVLRDLSELIQISVMPKMPLFLIAIIFILVNVYGTFTGIENLSRAAQIFLPLLVFFFVMEWVFLYTTPEALKFYNIKPVLEKGILSVIKEGWPLITFPYGETILFAMFYPSVVESSKVRKTTVLAILFVGILLSLNSIMFISVLGVDFASTSLFPLLQTLRIMHIGETFDRLDIFTILIIILGGFFKISFFMYGAMLGTAQLVKLKDPKYLAIPFGIVILVASQLIAKNYPQHIKIGLEFTVKYIHVPFIIGIPIATFLVYYIKNCFKIKQ